MSLPADIIALGADRSYVRGERPGWTYGIEDGEFECWDTWLVPFSVLTSVLEKIAGTVEVIGGTAARRVPLMNTDFTNAQAYRVEGEDDGWDRTANTRAITRIRIRYRIPAYPTTGTDAYIRKTTAPGVRSMQMHPSATGLSYWKADAVPTVIYNFELMNLAEIDVPSLATYGGYRNLNTWRDFPPGTVKFIPPTSYEQRTVLGGRQYQATYGFEVCRIPWDQEYNEAGTLVSTGYPPYADFATVFGF